MSDQDIPTSGSRWEPTTMDLTAPIGDTAVQAEPVAVPAGVGLVLAGGIGGFAIGQAMAGDAFSDGTVADQNGVPAEGNGGRPDFHDGDGPLRGAGPRDTSPDARDDGGTS